MNVQTHLTSVAALLAVFSATAAATPIQTGTWNELFPATTPPGTAGHDVVSDGTRALSFGGKELGAGLQNKIWAFDGADWSDISPSSGPAPEARKTGGVVWDSGRGRLVVFGGEQAGNTPSNDTWEWDGATWTQMNPVNSPPPMRQCEMVYVAGLGKTYLFGGADDSQVYDETWEWNGSNWTQLFPATTPPARRQHHLASDTLNNRVVMYGGLDTAGASSSPLSDTWVFDGTNWTEIVTTNYPSSNGAAGLYNGGMCYDPTSNKVVLFGGVQTGPTLPGTWEFDGSDWTNLGIPGAGDRQATSMIYVAGLGRIILFGGFRTSQMNDTWEFVGPNIGTNYCSPADNSTGSAAIMSATGSPSIAAGSLELSASPVPNEPYVFYTGPLQLSAPFGDGVRCVGGAITRIWPATMAVGNTASRTIDPSAFNLTAGTWNFQCWFRDPNGNGGMGAGFNLSDGLEVVLVP